MMHLDMSLFSGCGLVRIKRDNNEYFEIQRVVSGNTVNFIYFCNQKTDYIDGEQEGQKYSVDMLKSMAEEIIDLIQKAEKKYQDDCMKDN